VPHVVILIPGWNEADDQMAVFANGRHGLPGLTDFGFRCAFFDGGRGSLRQRIDQLLQYVVQLGPGRFSLFGYSAGGLIARGLLRAYPDAPISAIFQLAAPNAGIVTDWPSALFHRIHFDSSVLEDMDIESDFMSWLNVTSGYWQTDPATNKKRWRLRDAPWVAPSSLPIFNFVGRLPRYEDETDGIVRVESATLCGAMPHGFIDGANANHLNMGGTWNPLTLALRGWCSDDRLWPQSVGAAARLFTVAR
jgi:pimeloyl-ACP methyl ester carboxylesterase